MTKLNSMGKQKTPQNAYTYTFRVELNDIEPVIWRRFEVSSETTLPDFHDILQEVMGWNNYHLHAYFTGTDPYDQSGTTYISEYSIAEGSPGVDEAEYCLRDVFFLMGRRLGYEYDFGDSWYHTITLEDIRPRTEADVLCTILDGKRACPPEDCGGPGGYSELCRLIASASTAGPASLAEEEVFLLTYFLGFDPEEFSVEEAQESLDCFSESIEEAETWTFIRFVLALEEAERILWLVERAVDGIPLTATKAIKPVVVREFLDVFEPAFLEFTNQVREASTPELRGIRDMGQSLGLLRPRKNKLYATVKGKKLVGNLEETAYLITEAYPSSVTFSTLMNHPELHEDWFSPPNEWDYFGPEFPI